MQNITTIITSHINTLYGDIGFFPALSAPPKSEHGEYCFGVFTLAKPLGRSPNTIAEEIATELRRDTTHFTQVNVIAGYVNFSCTARVWTDILSQVQNPPTPLGQGGTTLQTIVVDYIGANAGKPLHIGHLCTPSIGQAICNIHDYLGYKVIGDSHFGDWGGIFGKLIWQWKNSTKTNIENQFIFQLTDETLKEFQTTKTSILHEIKDKNISEKLDYLLEKFGIDLLVRLYQIFHTTEIDSIEGNNLIEEKNQGAMKEFQYLSSIGIDLSNSEELKHHEENVELWKRFTAISITEIEKKLDTLNVHATYNIGESFYEGLGLPRPNNEDYPDLQWNMKDIVLELIKNKVATQNEDGSVGVVFPEEMKLPSCILQKKDGTGLYLTSDLAAIKYRLTNGWNPAKIIYSVDVRQQLHLRQAFAIAKMAWPELTEGVEFFHAFNGFIKLKEGAMSTRHGTVIFLEKLIEEGEERISRVLEEKGRSGENSLKKEDIESITVGAIKYSYLSQDREKDVTFDWDKALSFEGNSGPYIQYAYVRAKKIATSPQPSPSGEGVSGTTSPLWRRGDGEVRCSVYDKSLIRTLAEMEQKIQTTADTYKPHTLALYCYDLAVCFNSFYVHTPKILEETDQNLRNLRLNLCKLTSEKLTLGFDLLGIKMPSEM